jgi:hypothetical protein
MIRNAPHLALALLALPSGSALAAPATALEPLAFLAGHCWQGTFEDGKTTDRHCFSWIYDGKFLRDQHIVHHGAGQPDGLGESIYFFDAGTRELQYLYIESAGGFSRGSVASEGSTLVFPATTYNDAGSRQTYRSRWQRTGSDGYQVVTEFQGKSGWTPGFSLHMQRVPD